MKSSIISNVSSDNCLNENPVHKITIINTSIRKCLTYLHDFRQIGLHSGKYVFGRNPVGGYRLSRNAVQCYQLTHRKCFAVDGCRLASVSFLHTVYLPN